MGEYIPREKIKRERVVTKSPYAGMSVEQLRERRVHDNDFKERTRDKFGQGG